MSDLIGYNLDELQRMGLAQSILASKEKFQLDQTTQKEEQERLREQGVLTIKILETQLLATRESMRPYRLHHASVGKCPETGKYFCRTYEYDEPDEDANEVIAYGDTPAEACDNFDALWIGNNQ